MQPSMQITCPECGYEKVSSLHISVQSATVRIPLKDGIPSPASEVLFEVPMEKDETLIRLSDIYSQTRVILFTDGIEILVNCPRCQKMLCLPEDTKIRCSVAD